ncbi:MAG: metallophosphoesterase family protein [Oscillospiraceae bacterium]|nr:metallophosphoesterase family protein [Oscillospiraceae bacterium]
MTKRLKRLLPCACLLCAGIVYLMVQNRWIQVEELALAHANIPAEYDGCRIAHISDTHLPRNRANVRKTIQLTKKLKPDLIVMTGDLVHSYSDMESCGFAELCAGLSEIAGVYAIKAKHDTWNDTEAWDQIALDNGVILSERLDLGGFTVLLSHDPKYFGRGEADLMLAGHIHGGQIRIPFLGGLLSPDLTFFPDYTSGLYETPEGELLVVSRGIGNSVIPIRVNNRPHLPVIILKSIGEEQA